MGRKKRAGQKDADTAAAEAATASTALPIPSTSEACPDTLPINKAFAERYEVSKRKQLLATVPATLLDNGSGSEASSSSEEEDEFGELLTKGIDRRVRETLEAIRNKDPRIYDRSARFFEEDGVDVEDGDRDGGGGGEEEEQESDEGGSEDEPVAGWDAIASAANAEKPKLTLKDYVRETLLNDGKLSDDEDDQVDDTRGENWAGKDSADRESGQAEGNAQPPASENRDQDANNVDSNSDENGSDEEDFFKKKIKSEAERKAEEKDFELFLKKQSKKTSQKAGEELLLHSYLENEKPDEKEQFLRDFVLNNGWLDKNANDAPAAGDYEIEIDHANPDGDGQDTDGKSDDFDEKVDEFEAKYNFRFEDPDGNQVISHARDVPDSMRRPDDRRKRAREARRAKKQQEKLAKTEDIKRLKNLKKKEVQARLLAIQEAAGDGIDVTGIDLDGNFDPDEFNRQMESKFGEEYYSKTDEDMKQQTKDGVAIASERRLPSKQSEEVPEDVREDVNKMMDEYYNLDYEDIVAGVPMRFNYKKVEPEAFNMTPEDILSMEDKELNRLVSLKFLAPYRANRDVKKQAWRVHDALKKQRRARKVNGENTHESSEMKALAMSKEDPGDVIRDENHVSAVNLRPKGKKRKRPLQNKKGDGLAAECNWHPEDSPKEMESRGVANKTEEERRKEHARKKNRKKKRKTLSQTERVEGKQVKE